MHGKKIGFIIDPVALFNKKTETTFFLMAEINRRRGRCFGFELKNLFADNGKICGLAEEICTKNRNGFFDYTTKSKVKTEVATLDALFLRKDPPVDLRFIDHLSLLELVEDQIFMVNRPSGIKRINEKLFTLAFADLIAPTLVSSNKMLIGDFIRQHKMAVIKPLNQAGGRGVLVAKNDDPSLKSLLEIVTKNETRYVMAQKFLPAVKKGDKRIFVLDGKILGSFKRLPQKGDFRGNLHSGARLSKATITHHDQKIVERLTPVLREFQQHLVGIDVISNNLTEINVTSPMGIHEINLLTGEKIERKIIDWLQNSIK